MTKSVTLKDVAKHAGVSFQTVSFVINNHPGVAESTRRKVWQAIRDTNYTPNGVARGLRKKQTRRLGLVVPTLLDSFYAELANSVEETTRSAGYTVMLLVTNFEPGQQLAIVNVLRSERIDGAILVLVGDDYQPIASLRSDNIPVTLVDTSTVGKDLSVPSIEIDNVGALSAATQHLIDLGHRRIGYVTEPLTMQSLHDRLKGYYQAMQEAGLLISPELIREEPEMRANPVASGYSAANRLLSLDAPPTAILAVSDLAALGTIKAAKDRGLAIPDDLSLIGFDDLTFSSFIDPALTSVRQPKKRIGRMAVELLLQLRNEGRFQGNRIVLETELIIRQTTGPRVARESEMPLL